MSCHPSKVSVPQTNGNRTDSLASASPKLAACPTASINVCSDRATSPAANHCQSSAKPRSQPRCSSQRPVQNYASSTPIAPSTSNPIFSVSRSPSVTLNVTAPTASGSVAAHLSEFQHHPGLPPSHPAAFHPAYSFPQAPFSISFKHADAATPVAAAVPVTAATIAALPPPHSSSAFVPHLSYMEGHFAIHTLIFEQQTRIKSLEAELEIARSEIVHLRAKLARSCDPSAGSNVPDTQAITPPDDSNLRQSSADDTKQGSSRYWTADEHARFLQGLKLFGHKDIKSISRHVGTRSATQVRTHAQKYYLRIERERAKSIAIATDRSKELPGDQESVYGRRPQSRESIASPGSQSVGSGGDACTSTVNGSSSSGYGDGDILDGKVTSSQLPSNFREGNRIGIHRNEGTRLTCGNGRKAKGKRGLGSKARNESKILESTSNAEGGGKPACLSGKFVKSNTNGRKNGDTADLCKSGISLDVIDGQQLEAMATSANTRTVTSEVANLNSKSEANVVNFDNVNGCAKKAETKSPSSDVNYVKEIRGKINSSRIILEKCKRKYVQDMDDMGQVKKRLKYPTRPSYNVAGSDSAKHSAKVITDDCREMNKECDNCDGQDDSKKGPVHNSLDTVVDVCVSPTNGVLRDQYLVAARSDPTVKEGFMEGKEGDNLIGSGAVSNSTVLIGSTACFGGSNGAKSSDSNHILDTAKSEIVVWSAQLPPRGTFDRGSSSGLIESCGSVANLRSLLLPGMDGHGTKAVTLKRNGSSNSLLAELPKRTGLLSRTNSFLISTNVKGVTRSSSILSLLSGIPTAMRESASSDRLLSLDDGMDMPDCIFEDERDCEGQDVAHCKRWATSLWDG